jgi:hypothetical protein
LVFRKRPALLMAFLTTGNKGVTSTPAVRGQIEAPQRASSSDYGVSGEFLFSNFGLDFKLLFDMIISYV